MDTLWQLTAVLLFLSESGCYDGPSVVSYHIYYEKSDAVFTAELEKYHEATWTLPNGTKLGPYRASQFDDTFLDADIRNGNGKVRYVPKLLWLGGFSMQANLTIINYKNGGTGEYFFKASSACCSRKFNFFIIDPVIWILVKAFSVVAMCVLCIVLVVVVYKCYRERQTSASGLLIEDAANNYGAMNNA